MDVFATNAAHYIRNILSVSASVFQFKLLFRSGYTPLCICFEQGV